MNKLFYFLIAVLLFSNCTHLIVRTGYKVKKSDYKTCEVVIKKNIVVSDTLAIKIGEVKLGESGFSVACSEEHAISILKGEACAINADLIIITEENRPDFWSSCYRCRAQFYQFNTKDIAQNVKSDETFNTSKVKDRVTNDRIRNTALFIGSGVIGAITGFLLYIGIK